MDIELIQAKWILRKLPVEELPKFAADLMVGGFSGPAVLNLASFHTPNSRGIEHAFNSVMQEVGRPPMSSENAARRYVREIATEIIRKKIDPYHGAREIWDLQHGVDHEIPELRIFVGLASEFEDTEDRGYKAELADRIIREANIVADGGWPDVP